nr:MAG TPA: hypothetical protein [Caudoviricetes sp.]
MIIFFTLSEYAARYLNTLSVFTIRGPKMHKPIGMPGKPCVYKEFRGFIYIVIY